MRLADVVDACCRTILRPSPNHPVLHAHLTNMYTSTRGYISSRTVGSAPRLFRLLLFYLSLHLSGSHAIVYLSAKGRDTRRPGVGL